MLILGYLLVLPFGVIFRLGWYSVGVQIGASCALLCVDYVSSALETPFGHREDPHEVELCKMVRKIDQHTAAIIASHLPGCEPVENYNIFPETSIWAGQEAAVARKEGDPKKSMEEMLRAREEQKMLTPGSSYNMFEAKSRERQLRARRALDSGTDLTNQTYVHDTQGGTHFPGSEFCAEAGPSEQSGISPRSADIQIESTVHAISAARQRRTSEKNAVEESQQRYVAGVMVEEAEERQGKEGRSTPSDSQRS